MKILICIREKRKSTNAEDKKSSYKEKERLESNISRLQSNRVPSKQPKRHPEVTVSLRPQGTREGHWSEKKEGWILRSLSILASRSNHTSTDQQRWFR